MAKSAQKNTLFISKSAPYSADNASRCLDSVLAAAVFEQPLSYLFIGDGVLQLLSEQNPSAIALKKLSSKLAALPLYGVEKIFVSTSALEERNLTEADLFYEENLSFDYVGDDVVAQMIQNCECVIAL